MPDLTPRAQAEAAARREREAAALRQNLHRRKAQVRAREDCDADLPGSTIRPDIRVRDVTVTDMQLSVCLMDGRTIGVPLAWFPRLSNASPAERAKWEISGAGYGIHWPTVDEDISTEALLLGEAAPAGSEHWRSSLASDN